MFEFLSTINLIALTVSAVTYFVLGALWFAPSFFGTMWLEELKKHGFVFNPPSSSEMLKKVVSSLIVNFIAVLTVAFFVSATGSTTLMSGLMLGMTMALGLAATTLGITYIWQSKSCKLFLIDIGYPIVGIILASIILSVWH